MTWYSKCSLGMPEVNAARALQLFRQMNLKICASMVWIPSRALSSKSAKSLRRPSWPRPAADEARDRLRGAEAIRLRLRSQRDSVQGDMVGVTLSVLSSAGTEARVRSAKGLAS